MEKKLSFILRVEDENGEPIYYRDFPTQEILEEHLREMEREVDIYLKTKEYENNLREEMIKDEPLPF